MFSDFNFFVDRIGVRPIVILVEHKASDGHVMDAFTRQIISLIQNNFTRSDRKNKVQQLLKR